MMSCCTIEELDLFVHRSLTPDRRSEIDRHTSTCDRCLAVLVEMRSHSELVEMLRQPDVDDPVPDDGELVAPDGYTLVRKLHEGGQGIVLEAIQQATGRRVAIKALRSSVALSTRARLRFERELEIVRRLEHPGIVRLYDAALDGERRYLVMELIEGRHLDRWAAEAEPGTTERLQLFVDVARAVQFAHAHGVIHRDLKPANILIDAHGGPRIVDFGIARPETPAADALTATGEFAGTLAYAAPEQLDAGDAVDVRADVYSLGVLLFQMLTNGHPFSEHRGFTQMVDAIRHVDVPLPREHGPELACIVARSMAKAPERRYESAAALADDVERYLDGRPIVARGDSPGYVLRKMIRRHRTASVLVAALLAVIVTAATVTAGLWRDAVADGRRAARAQALANERLTAVLRLADVKRARDLIEEADDLHPVSSALGEACDGWLHRADAVLGRAATHAARLADLRRGALPATESDRRLGDRDAWQRHRDIETELEELDRGELDDDAYLTRRETLSEELEDRLESRRRRRYDDASAAWRDDVLAELARLMTRLRAVRSSVLARRDASRGLRARTIDGHRDAWRRCIDAVANDDVYRGLVLEPIEGLVPLGPDPHSGLQEFWHVVSGERPERSGDGRYGIGEKTGMILVLLPGGTVSMGAHRPGSTDAPAGPHADPHALRGSGPVHEVKLAPFLVSRYEMTRSQWVAAGGAEPAGWRMGDEYDGVAITGRHPVVHVDWWDARRCARRSGLDLPTEAQWEYACRAGTTTPWPTGDRVSSLNGSANLYDAGSFPPALAGAFPATHGLSDDHRYLAAVGTFRPNAFGLHDMIGNVLEWCADRPVRYDSGVIREGDAHRFGPAPADLRVGRGGSCSRRAEVSGSAARFHLRADQADPFTGLRPVMRLP